MEQQLSRTVRKGDAMQVIDNDGTKLVEATFGCDRRGRPMMTVWSALEGRVMFVRSADSEALLDDPRPVG